MFGDITIAAANWLAGSYYRPAPSPPREHVSVGVVTPEAFEILRKIAEAHPPLKRP